MNKKKIIVVGGGFAGLEATKVLADEPGVEVTLIDRNNYHTFQPLLYQVATSSLEPAEVCPTLRGVFQSVDNVRVLMGEVSSVDPESSTVVLDEERLSYDYLIMAIGGRTTYFGKEEWRERSTGLKELHDALTIRARLLKSFEEAEREPDPEKRKEYLTTVIVGGGPTGVELAGALAELRTHVLKGQYQNFDPAQARIVLIEALPQLLNGFPDKLGQYTKDVLEELGVEVVTGQPVKNLERNAVHTADTSYRARNIVWAAGVEGYPMAKELGADTTKKGTVKVCSDLRLSGRNNIFCTGDMAHFETENGKPLPGLAPVAMQQGAHAAQNILRLERGDLTEKFVYNDRGAMAVIGRTHAVANLFGKKPLKGFVAWIAWLFIHLLFLVGYRNKAVVMIRWLWSYIGWRNGARVLNTLYLKNDPLTEHADVDKAVEKELVGAGGRS